ncbi:hypothetical protein [Cupriavidus necator]|nr:hypothetical protein [Cupriavidus necator]
MGLKRRSRAGHQRPRRAHFPQVSRIFIEARLMTKGARAAA